MTFSRHGILKLAALGLLACVLCLAQFAAAGELPLNPGSVQGIQAELAQIIEWERVSPGAALKKEGENDAPGICAGDDFVVTGILRLNKVSIWQSLGDGIRRVALPAIRAPPRYATSA